MAFVGETRYVCFTINNPPHGYAADLVLKLQQHCSYYIFCLEIGDSGTPHFQGYLESKIKHRLSWLKNNIDDGAHYERRKGSAMQAAEYCKKSLEGEDEEGLYEYGTPRHIELIYA